MSASCRAPPWAGSRRCPVTAELRTIPEKEISAGDFTVAADHPCLAGHFPGRPVVPGVMLLDEVFSCIRNHAAITGTIMLDAVKFMAPVLPGQHVRVILEIRPRRRVGFDCEVEGARVMAGTASFAAIS